MTDPERGRLIQRALAGAHVDALICALPKNVLMLSGYWPVIGTGVAVAFASGETRVIVPRDEMSLAERGHAARVHAFQPGSLETMASAANAIVEPLREAAKELGPGKVRIAFEGGETSEPASYAAMHLYQGAMRDVLTEAFPSADPIPAGEILTELLAVKTASEVARIRAATRIGAEAFHTGAAQLRPGMTEVEAAAIFRAPLGTGNADAEVERADGFVFCMSGSNSAEAYGAYARSRRRRMATGDLVLVHMNSYADGYWTDITRTYVLGAPDERQQRMYEAMFAAREAALQEIAPGKNARDVDGAARQSLHARGYGANFKHSTGHGVGFGAISANDRPRLHPKSPDVLQPGMVFNVEPAIYFDGYGGMRHCDMVAVTESGYELLTDFQSSMERLVRK